MNELQRETGSHLSAAIAGWGWASPIGEIAQLQHLQAYLSTHTVEKAEPPQIPMPWDQPETAKPVGDEERARLRALLNAQSAFRDH